MGGLSGGERSRDVCLEIFLIFQSSWKIFGVSLNCPTKTRKNQAIRTPLPRCFPAYSPRQRQLTCCKALKRELLNELPLCLCTSPCYSLPGGVCVHTKAFPSTIISANGKQEKFFFSFLWQKDENQKESAEKRSERFLPNEFWRGSGGEACGKIFKKLFLNGNP